jgi:hypothetical protein
VLLEQPDLNSRQVSSDEERFINLIVLHTFAAYRASKAGIYVRPENLSKDVGGFFALPIPFAVWTNLKEFQDRDFVSFIDKSIVDFKAGQSVGGK